MSNSSKNIYPPMDRANRAKQFMPFDALRGFREALAEKEKSIVLEIEFENTLFGGTDLKEIKAVNEKYTNLPEHEYF